MQTSAKLSFLPPLASQIMPAGSRRCLLTHDTYNNRFLLTLTVTLDARCRQQAPVASAAGHPHQADDNHHPVLDDEEDVVRTTTFQKMKEYSAEYVLGWSTLITRHPNTESVQRIPFKNLLSMTVG